MKRRHFLDLWDIGYVLRLVSEGWYYKTVARVFQVDPTTVSRICRGTRRAFDTAEAIRRGYDKDPYLEELKSGKYSEKGTGSGEIIDL